ncbi:MAG: rod shape-determining protein MreD [Ornithinimicrobium sp.]
MHLVPAVGLRVALVLLAAVLMSLPIPLLPAVPDVMIVIVAVTALTKGPWAGALIGLAGGWLIDVVPPGASPLGASALVYAAVGAGLGAARRYLAATPTAGLLPLIPWAVVALASALVLLVRLITAAAGVGAADLTQVGWAWLLTVVLTPLLLPPLVWLERWLAVRRWG